MKSTTILRISLFLLIAITIGFVYTGILTDGKIKISPHTHNYFKDLAISFSHGRLDVDCPPGTNCHDLSQSNGKFYLYWPAVPAIVYMPLTAIFAKNTPDTLIANCLGALNVFLLMILLQKFSKKYRLELNSLHLIFIAIFWGLGTVHFYMSMIGSVWYISQVMANTFLLLAIICILSGNSPIILFLSGLFYAMAVYTKNNQIFSIFIIAAIYITKNKLTNKKSLSKM